MKRLALAAYTFACATLVQAQQPPPIPHSIDGYLVTRQENNCLECHDKPRAIGRKRTSGMPTPAPKSHYANLDAKPEIANGHFTCTNCHAPK